MNQGMWVAFRSWKSQGNGFFPSTSGRKTALPILDFNPVRPMIVSKLQNCKIVNLDCFKPLSVNSFRAEVEN